MDHVDLGHLLNSSRQVADRAVAGLA